LFHASFQERIRNLLARILSNKANLEHVLDNLQEGIIAHDLDRKIFFFNREAENITGYNREELLGKDCHEVFDGPLCGKQCSFCGGQPLPSERKQFVTHILTKNGEDRRVQMTVTLMVGGTGDVLGVLASFKDLTDLLDLQIRARRLSSFSNIIGQDIKMLKIFQQISDVSGYDYPVHISGETGTGKELVAAAIHNESKRGGAPFVPVNCGALPENLIESELFGHVKGAFTGAIRDKKGRFELANNGTLFLDEVGELSKHIQVKLLRFLQEGKFEKVGGEKTLAVNVRIISATNRDLKKEVLKNRFRDDLYYRLNVIPIHIPPLRDRKNDIPLLVNHFLRVFFEENAFDGLTISKDALHALMRYHWPGNIRELQNAIQFAIVHCNDAVIMPEDLPMEFKALQDSSGNRGPDKKLSEGALLAALSKSGGNKTKAARLLGVGRATLYRFLEDHPDVLSGSD
jgi:sigma-54 dependent transcriptional regulator, acetoin dehydrogenase operon transcriptional activator AcoR